jgi:hypothetical protein
VDGGTAVKRAHRVRNSIVDKAARQLRAEYPGVEIRVSWSSPHWHVNLKDKDSGGRILTFFHWAGEDRADAHIRAGIAQLSDLIADGLTP